MDIVWNNEGSTAREIAILLKERIGWSKTTSYTMITRCVQKGYVLRTEPRFVCTSIASRDDVARWETQELLEHHFQGSAALLVRSLVNRKKLTSEKVEQLYHELLEREAMQ